MTQWDKIGLLVSAGHLHGAGLAAVDMSAVANLETSLRRQASWWTAIGGGVGLRLLCCALFALATLSAVPRLAESDPGKAAHANAAPINLAVVVNGLDVSLKGRNRALPFNLPTIEANQPNVGLAADVAEVPVPSVFSGPQDLARHELLRGFPRTGHARDPPLVA